MSFLTILLLKSLIQKYFGNSTFTGLSTLTMALASNDDTSIKVVG